MLIKYILAKYIPSYIFTSYEVIEYTYPKKYIFEPAFNRIIHGGLILIIQRYGKINILLLPFMPLTGNKNPGAIYIWFT